MNLPVLRIEEMLFNCIHFGCNANLVKTRGGHTLLYKVGHFFIIS